MTRLITQSVADVFRRPADCNFNSMEDLLKVAEQEMRESRTISTTGPKISFATINDRFFITIDQRSSFPLTNYSMTQVAAMAKINTDTLERLHRRDRNDLVVDNLNTLFVNGGEDKFVLVRDHYEADGAINSVARAVNGGAYARLWDFEVFAEMEDFLMPQGFTPNLPNIRANAMRSGLMHGLNTGLFRGDQCSFGFFFVDKELVGDSTSLGGLKPGMMVWNSEVGARSFGYHTFYYHEMSGSIIIWTPANQERKRFVHRGDIKKAFKEYVKTLEDVATNFQQRFTHDLELFNLASVTPYAADRDAVIQKLQKDLKMSAANARFTVDAAALKQNSYGTPMSVWNIALGIAWEAGQTGRAESLVDNTLVATKMMRSALRA